MISPTSITSTLGCFEANATTDAGGSPTTYSSDIEVLIASEIFRAALTIFLQDSKYPLSGSKRMTKRSSRNILGTHVLHDSPSSCQKCTRSVENSLNDGPGTILEKIAYRDPEIEGLA